MNPFELRLPASEGLPLVYDSPHSGRYYPEDFRFKPPLPMMRRGEDAYVDELIADAPARGVTVLLANYPRVYVDANREHDDIDEALLAEPWPGTLRPTGKSRRGLGLIRRDIVPGIEVHAEKLTVAEVKRRLNNVYWPYHRALRAELDRAKARFGFVWHIDWHSMKSIGNRMTPDGESRRADFVIGDLDGASAERELVEIIVGSLRDFGYRVVLNDPYRGAAIVRRSAAPERGFHSVQIEINRALYLNEAAVELNAGFEKLRADIEAFTVRLVEAARARIC